MKKVLTILLIVMSLRSIAQNTPPAKTSDLGVPTSPAFILTDITPTLVQTPSTPKALVLGVAQSYAANGNSFPNNYAASFTPYWWLQKQPMDTYDVQGIKTSKDYKGTITAIGAENHFSGLRFTSVSIAFINKDLIPDASDASQKVVSVGLRATILKFHRGDYGKDVRDALTDWHKGMQAVYAANPDYLRDLAQAGTPADHQAVVNKYDAIFKAVTLDKINVLIAEKPIFSWDIAAAYAVYGVDNQAWKSGRTGVWSSFSFNIPFNINKTPGSYFNLNGLLRYQDDQFYAGNNGTVGPNKSIDVGGNATIEIKNFSIGVESLYRFNNGIASNQNRTVGIINYKIADNLYINGAFGKNFTLQDKLIAALGINFGLGKENTTLPQLQ